MSSLFTIGKAEINERYQLERLWTKVFCNSKEVPFTYDNIIKAWFMVKQNEGFPIYLMIGLADSLLKLSLYRTIFGLSIYFLY